MNIGTWEAAKLEILSPKGVPRESDQYYFIRQQKIDRLPIDIIDLEKSSINYRKTGEIKNVISLAIKDEETLDFFSINDVSLVGRIFLSPAAAEALNQLELKGVEIVSTDKLGAIESA